ncbi:MAG: hypothetical protein ABJB03_01670 [Rhodoglobus sp.]
MRSLNARLVALATVLLVALAVSQGSSPAAVVASIAAIVLTTAIAVRVATLAVGGRELTVGARSHEHRQALNEVPAPAHPSTAGRPMTRAPSMVASAA